MTLFRRFRLLTIFTLILTALCVSSVEAKVKLPSLFADHMVLQRDKPVVVWGWADPKEEVTVTLAGKSVTATGNAEGEWQVSLPAMPAGGPHTIQIRGAEQQTINDVYVGEVWICSGQSNMAMSVKRSKNSKKEIANAKYPMIRMFTIPRTPADKPQDNCKGSWKVCSPKTAGGFSGVGYFFGRALEEELDIPIGLIHTSWGGTRCEAWTSHEALEGDEDIQPILDRVTTEKESRHRAAHLYNGMLHPLLKYPIQGAIWYQGESNVARAAQYGKLFPNMITDWRAQFNQGDFPFYFVQLAPYHYSKHKKEFCAELWEAQTKTLSLPNTGMAVINDVGNLKDIHPKNKQDVGKRLALWALNKNYGKSDLVYSGPLYKSSQVDGDKIRITLNHTGGGLVSRDDKPLDEFQIAGADKKFVPAVATIEGDQVVVQSESVKNPVAVRFAWHDSAQPNLMNKEGLPASSFRTDDWPLLTKDNK